MTAVFTWTGFVCLLCVIVAATLYAVSWAIRGIFVNTEKSMQVFRVVWRFYKSIPRAPEHHHRYFITIYDRSSTAFIATEPLDDDFLTDAEREAKMDEMRQRLARRKEDSVSV